MQVTPNSPIAKRASSFEGREFDSSQILRGTSILIVEDEAFLAMDIASMLSGAGALVEGPLNRLEQAMAYSDFEVLDAAVLDVDIAGDEIFRFADRLIARKIPIVFHTGRVDIEYLASRYPDARIVRKPCLTREFVAALSTVILKSGSVPRAAS